MEIDIANDDWSYISIEENQHPIVIRSSFYRPVKSLRIAMQKKLPVHLQNFYSLFKIGVNDIQAVTWAWNVKKKSGALVSAMFPEPAPPPHVNMSYEVIYLQTLAYSLLA